MLSLPRFFISAGVLLCCIFAVCAPGFAQAIGVAPPMPSMGMGAPVNLPTGIVANITALPKGYGGGYRGNDWLAFGNCCANFFTPAPRTARSGQRHEARGERARDRRGDRTAVGILEPVYVPFAVPYAADSEDEAGESGSSEAGQAEDFEASGQPAGIEEAAGKEPVSVEPSIGMTKEVTAQPSTVLIFKDGRHSELRNYAIVGGTLFDFSSGHTHKIQLTDLDLPATQKANDDQGVDFEVPANPSLSLSLQ